MKQLQLSYLAEGKLWVKPRGDGAAAIGESVRARSSGSGGAECPTQWLARQRVGIALRTASSLGQQQSGARCAAGAVHRTDAGMRAAMPGNFFMRWIRERWAGCLRMT